jgi:hypothetical protein
MAWQLAGQWLESCSCKMMCRCVFGPAEPDQGWCSGSFAFDIERGTSDGVDLGGTRALLLMDFPGDPTAGNGVARVYLDERASAEQRRELDAIFTGQRGGNWEAFSGLFASFLPAETARIDIQPGDTTTVTVGNVGVTTLQAVRAPDGKQATMTSPPAMHGFLERLDLAMSTGSRWADPQMRAWEGGGYGITASFDWSA